MNHANMDTLTAPKAAPTQGLGAMLRQARERRGLSQGDLARELNLGPRLVDALEQEDTQALPDPVYVRGYLRRLAAALQLDEAAVQRAYVHLVGEPEPAMLRANAPVGSMREPRSGRSFPWLKLVLALIVIGAGLYLVRFLPADSPLIQQGKSGAQLEMPPASPLPIEPASMPAPAPSIPQSMEPPPAPAPIVGEVIEPQPEPSVAVEAVSPPPSPTLELHVSGTESWVMIKDAKGRVLLEGMLPSGTTRQVEGERPFEVVVGNAAATRLLLDGQPVELAPYTRPNGKAVIGKLGG